jgi:hypothetical protein
VNAVRTLSSEAADTLLPGPLRRNPTLVRLRACLLAQRPELGSVDEVCSRLLTPASSGADDLATTSPAVPLGARSG